MEDIVNLKERAIKRLEEVVRILDELYRNYGLSDISEAREKLDALGGRLATEVSENNK